MFRQLSYSGTLEVTEIRKAGLNVRGRWRTSYRYIYISAQTRERMLRAFTVTKRCIMLLEQLGIDENKWRVGKTLVFLKDYEIMDQLDNVREEKIVEYVIILTGVVLPRVQGPAVLPPLQAAGPAHTGLHQDTGHTLRGLHTHTHTHTATSTLH